MKILMVHDISHMYGGGESYIINIRKKLEEEGHKVRVAAAKTGDDQQQIADYFLKSYEGRISSRLSRIINLKAYFQMKKITKEFKPDIIHIHSLFYRLSPFILGALKKYPIVVTVHNYVWFCGNGVKYYQDNFEICNQKFGSNCYKRKCLKKNEYFLQKILRFFNKIYFKNINYFITCSSYGYKLVKQNSFNNVKMLLHGIDVKDNSFQKLSNEKNFLFIGRLEKEKGVDYLIRAFAYFKNEKGIKLFIAGDGPEKNNLINLSRNLKVKNVFFLGKISREEIKKYYSESIATVVPSIWPENSPIVIYESLSYGRPVIGTVVGGIPDLVKNKKNGLLIKRKDAEAIFNAMNYLINNKNIRESLSINARKFAEDKINIDIHIKKLVNIYYESINSNSE